jgi:hypothetical protein
MEAAVDLPDEGRDESVVCAEGATVKYYGSIQPFLKIIFNNYLLDTKIMVYSLNSDYSG